MNVHKTLFLSRPLPRGVTSPTSYYRGTFKKGPRTVSNESPSDIRARGYRATAERLHQQAAEMPWRDLREQLDKIAHEYDLLADSAERKQRGD